MKPRNLLSLYPKLNKREVIWIASCISSEYFRQWFEWEGGDIVKLLRVEKILFLDPSFVKARVEDRINLLGSQPDSDSDFAYWADPECWGTHLLSLRDKLEECLNG